MLSPGFISALCDVLVVVWKVVTTTVIVWVVADLTVAYVRARRRRIAESRRRHPAQIWHDAAAHADQELRRRQIVEVVR